MELKGQSKRNWPLYKRAVQTLRRETTTAERALWDRVRNRRLGGLKFRRQYWLQRFVADFYCAEARRVVEIDGPIHEGQGESDATRQEFIETMGLRVIRFTNQQIESEMETVLSRILAVCAQASSPSPLRGEGQG